MNLNCCVYTMRRGILPDVSSIGYLEGLQEEKAQLQADLAAIERLIARAGGTAPGATEKAKVPKQLRLVKSSKRHTFKPNPRSLASRALTESRKALENAAGRELSFATLCQRLPRDIVGTSKQRQYLRLTIQRSGKREGLEYQDANCVKIV